MLRLLTLHLPPCITLTLLTRCGVAFVPPPTFPLAHPPPQSTRMASLLLDADVASRFASARAHAAFLIAESGSAGSAADVAAGARLDGQTLASALLHSPTLWSILAMTSIVALLVGWEEAVEKVRHNTPKPIRPVIDSMLAEVGGLGFIGLFLSTVVTGGPLGQVIAGLSEEFLGDEELLLETFEFLHTFFFQVGIAFFLINGVVIYKVLEEVQKLGEISELALDIDGDGEVTLDELAEGLNVESIIVDLDGDGIVTEEEKVEALRLMPAPTAAQKLLKEYSMSITERSGEQLVIRERMMQEMSLPPTFAIEDYFSQIFGSDLEEVVELSPVTWLPLIPLIALDNSVDLSRDVVSATSSNAYDSCGYFFADPWVLYSTILLQVFSLTWAVFNFWKMSSIKDMLLPTLVKENSDSAAILLPPRYLDEYFLDRFDSSPTIFRWAEQLFTRGGSPTPSPRNAHEQLFGATGAAFPKVYQDSIRLNTWLCIALVVYATTQIVFRDATAMYIGANVGDPETILPELVLWSGFVVAAIFQLSLAPTTFLNYCFVTSVEEFLNKDVLQRAILNDPNCSLSALVVD